MFSACMTPDALSSPCIVRLVCWLLAMHHTLQNPVELCHMLMSVVTVDATKQLCTAVLEHASYGPTSTEI